ncbi:hypothetical protein [Streptomyces sp. NPDC052012]|uniref:RraA family protein n=1 Tax=Streptomyces sp. NPDC052012 TaxID=3155051 RepID=UPI00344F3A95
MAGVLTDARLRDFDELRTYPFAACCSGAAVRWGGDVITPYRANVPVGVAGVGVLPGQYVFADDSGAVVIPEPDIDAVLAGSPDGAQRGRRVPCPNRPGAPGRQSRHRRAAGTMTHEDNEGGLRVASPETGPRSHVWVDCR